MIKTKSIYEPVSPEDGKRILVMRCWPQRFANVAALSLYAWMKELAPSIDLLRTWQRGRIMWPEFISRFQEEMKDLIPVRLTQDLAALAVYSNITLLCAEVEQNSRCHRHLLKKLIEDQIALAAHHALTGE